MIAWLVMLAQPDQLQWQQNTPDKVLENLAMEPITDHLGRLQIVAAHAVGVCTRSANRPFNAVAADLP